MSAFLLDGRQTRPVDLSDTMVIVPTAGASRAIRAALARQSGGVLSPFFRLPMEALLEESATMASPIERLAAWVQVLRQTRRGQFAALVPPAVKLSAPEDWIGVATRLNEACDTLAEAGLSPADEQVAAACPGDVTRWSEFAALHADYNKLLRAAGRLDANLVRRSQTQNPTLPENVTRIVIAAVPDIPLVVTRWLEALEDKGVSTHVLCAPCGKNDSPVDRWGRPDQEWWLAHQVQVPAEILVVENDTAEEACALAEFAAQHGKEGFALASASPESTAALEAEVAKRGALPYLPEGRPLRQTQAASILAAWDDFHRNGRLRSLRPLLQLPVFLDWFSKNSELSSDDAAAACDRLLAEKLCHTVDAAREWSRGNNPDKAETRILHNFIDALDNFITQHSGGEALLERLYSGGEPVGEQVAAELETLVDVLQEANSSPLLAGLSPEWCEAFQRNLFSTGRVFTAAPDHAVEIHGWLEALWLDAPVLCVGGCREGALPSGVREDAFLPDHVRVHLGLPSQSSRCARDASILDSLLAIRGTHRLRLGYSRFRPEGEPNRPSRLLFGCPDEELPQRVEKIFQPSSLTPRAPRVSAGWKLHLDPPLPVEAIRVTGFKHYLQCPLRFYLSQVKKLQPFDPDQREINPADYGTLLHRVVENFHKSGPADSTDEKIISRWLDEHLDSLVVKYYGRHPAPVVRVQTASMRVRLRHLAALQAAERRAGWRIIETEYAVDKKSGFTVGPLVLTGTIDRVEAHEEHGLRVLDYKTFNTTKTPEDTHFGPPRPEEDFAGESVIRRDKQERTTERSWADLQLPLYRRLAAEIWPAEAKLGLSTGYILLPGDPDDTKIVLLDIDPVTQSSAESCAEAVADRIARGVFWPPAENVAHDAYADWFGGGHPEDVFDPETIASLEGHG